MAPATPKLAALTMAAEVCVAVEVAFELVELGSREMTSSSAVKFKLTLRPWWNCLEQSWRAKMQTSIQKWEKRSDQGQLTNSDE